MAESPTPIGQTPATGTSPGLSPARTPPALLSVEELLQNIDLRSPMASQTPPSTSGRSQGGAGVAPRARPRYPRLAAASASHPLQGIQMPPEGVLRAAALEGRPDVGPPPRLPHQLSPALQAVLLGWRSLYEQCRSPSSLQALVGECYAPGAVFEDALVSAAGQEALYRQFALLGAAVRAVQVGAYSLSVAPLAQPAVAMRPPPPPSPSRSACFVVALPPLVSWLLGGGEEIPLYVTSVLLVASDAPLAHDGAGGADTTASRLASAAAALGESLSQPSSALSASSGGAGGSGVDPLATASGMPPYGGGVTHWRILHHLDRWHNVPLVWWVLRRAAARAVDAVLVPLLLRRQG
eukprot:XP_001700887.1 predicted protein [Chlamydomonas reinhardtii]